MTKVNCWEFKDCGREPGGKNSKELGICDAAKENGVNGKNGGNNGGRICWAVTGTLCKGKTQGVFAEKLGNCVACDFYQKVLEEEDNFEIYPL